MQKIKMIVAYDGSDFSGWQAQNNQRTVQGEIERSLEKLLKEPIKIHGAGRTDTGVHASGQVVHFEINDLNIPPEKLHLAIAGFIPKDIKILESSLQESDFHARYNAKKRIYRYKMLLLPLLPYQRNYYCHFEYKPSYKKISRILNVLQGEHDFTSFSLKDTDTKTRIRKIFKIKLEKTPGGFDIIIEANGFLRKMIRMIIGSLLKVYPYNDPAKRMKRIMEEKNNEFCGAPAPSAGLYFENVLY